MASLSDRLNLNNAGIYGQIYTVTAWIPDITQFTYAADGISSYYFIAIPNSAGVPVLTTISYLSISGGLGPDIAGDKLSFSFHNDSWVLYRMSTCKQGANALLTINYGYSCFTNSGDEIMEPVIGKTH